MIIFKKLLCIIIKVIGNRVTLHKLYTSKQYHHKMNIIMMKKILNKKIREKKYIKVGFLNISVYIHKHTSICLEFVLLILCPQNRTEGPLEFNMITIHSLMHGWLHDIYFVFTFNIIKMCLESKTTWNFHRKRLFRCGP